MRIVVLGAGAMGSLVGAFLSRDNKVTLVGRKDHMAAVRERGLSIEGMENFDCRVEAVEEVTSIDPPDMVILTVKAFDTRDAIPKIRSLKGRHTKVVALQNGLDNHYLVAEEIDGAVSGLTSWGATYLGPGRVRMGGRGDIVFGSICENDTVKEWVADVFRGAGMACRTSSDMIPEIWLKTVVNACINPITALVRKENGCLMEPGLGGVARCVCDEGLKVADSCGIRLPVDQPFNQVLEVVKRTSQNRSSMLQDIERGKRTEIDDITGALVRRGERNGVSTPVNRVLWKLVSSVQHGAEQW